jgi:hypothetical protein
MGVSRGSSPPSASAASWARVKGPCMGRSCAHHKQLHQPGRDQAHLCIWPHPASLQCALPEGMIQPPRKPQHVAADWSACKPWLVSRTEHHILPEKDAGTRYEVLLGWWVARQPQVIPAACRQHCGSCRHGVGPAGAWLRARQPAWLVTLQLLHCCLQGRLCQEPCVMGQKHPSK